MLGLGMARVYTFPDNRAMAAEMLALEQQARKVRHGIWDHPFYALRKPENLARRIGTFQIIEATVAAAAKVKAREVTALDDGEVLGRISLANPGLIRRDARKMPGAAQALRPIPCEELMAKCAREAPHGFIPLQEPRHEKLTRERRQLHAPPLPMVHLAIRVLPVHHTQHGPRLGRVVREGIVIVRPQGLGHREPH